MIFSSDSKTQIVQKKKIEPKKQNKIQQDQKRKWGKSIRRRSPIF